MSGFDFSNHIRNNHLGKNVMVPGARSTGTTIVGCLFDGGIVLGADTRATEGPIVADKNCEKVSRAPLESAIADGRSRAGLS